MMAGSGIPQESVNRFGLSQVYTPTGEGLVDVVFIHGLNGHPYQTWTSEKSKIFWPSQLLPSIVEEEKARILVYGYDADVTSFTDGVSKDKIHNHAEGLVAELCANRRIQRATQRPIIFVAHSLGGLVIKRALIYSSAIRNHKTEHLRSIFVSTYGILFLGTPHRGSDVAEWGARLEWICGAVLPSKLINTQPQLVNALKTHSETLQNIDRHFIHIASRFHIYFFHEGKPTNLKGTLRYIVNEESASPNFPDVERASIQQDHSHMCKFEDNNTPGFHLVTEGIQRYASQALETIVSRWVSDNAEQRKRKQAEAEELLPRKVRRGESTASSSSTSPGPSKAMSTSSTGKVWVYRREEIPVGTSKETLRQSFPPDVRDQIKITSLSPGINLNRKTLTATFSFHARPGDELLLSEDRNFYGFTPLYTPEGCIEADIVAITGLAGHAFGSWAASPHMWLRDFLPNDLPRARVLLYGYDSNLVGNQSRNILTDFNNNFVAKFYTMRSLSGSETRPVIFIGHSLGCLIIKDALTSMMSHPHHLSQSPPIVKAVIFFGAPHRGLNITAMQSIMKGTPSAELIRELEWQSPTVQRLNDGFRHVCEDLDILTIYEKKPTATLRKSKSGGLERTGAPEMMVEKDAALLYLRKEIPIGLEQDHSRIAKVDRGQNGCYDDIVNFIRQSISSLSTQIAIRNTRGIGSPVTSHSRDVIYQEPPGPPKTSKPLFLVPFSRDGSFINRVEIFNDIDKRIKQHRRLALSGIGGVGKSQIAIEYCYRFCDDHPHAHIVWVHASTKQRFDQAYRDIARRLELPGWNDPKVDTLRLVFEWFNEADNGDWLMVLDNADDLDMFFAKPTSTATDGECTQLLTAYLPQNPRGSMLITTRDERIGTRLAGKHASIVVNPMAPREAQELLAKLQMEPHYSLDQDVSRNLLEALEYLPLAITQASAFISENHITLAEYLEMFHTSDSDVQDLLDEDLGDLRRDSESQNSVIRTWKLSFDLIRKQRPRAAEMLSLMAVLDRQGIPKSLLRDDTDRNVDFATALGTLQSFSLISTGVDGAGYELHRLVQLATRKWLEIQDTIQKWQEKALLVVAKTFPPGRFEDWMTCESLLPHAQMVIRYGDTNGTCPEEYSKLLLRMAYFDCEQGRYEMACVRGLAAVDMSKKVSGLEYSLTLQGMNNLAVTYEKQGRWEEAEKLHMQVLETQKRVLGAEHPGTLQSMNNLAVTYEKQGRWEEAEKLHMQILETRKRVLGAEHPGTLLSMNNLAVTYRQQGRWEEAEKLHVQVLETRKRVLGAEHPDTLLSMNNLAVTYEKQGRWEEAEKLHVQVLETQKRVLGAEHPDTLQSMNNLAVVYDKQARRSEAIALMESVVGLRTRILGANHPDTINSVDWLKEWLDT